MTVSESTRALSPERASVDDMVTTALEEGMLRLRYDGWRRCARA
jgi:hypothetical protein